MKSSGSFPDPGLTLGTYSAPSLTMDGGSMFVAGTLTLTGATVSGPGGSITGGQVDLNASAKTFDVTGGLSISSTMQNGRVIKTGAGRLDLTGTNTFSGQTLVSAGTLRGHAQSIGNDVLNNSVVELRNGTYSGNISGPGSVGIVGSTTLASLNSYLGGTSIADGGTLTSSSQYLYGTITGGGGTATLRLSSATDETLGASLAGTLNVTKLGMNVTTINSAQNYTGTTTVTGGTLRLAANGAIGTGTLVLNNATGLASLEAVRRDRAAASAYIGRKRSICRRWRSQHNQHDR